MTAQASAEVVQAHSVLFAAQSHTTPSNAVSAVCINLDVLIYNRCMLTFWCHVLACVLSLLQIRYVPAPPSPLQRASAVSSAPSLLPTRQIPSPPQHQYVPMPLTIFATGACFCIVPNVQPTDTCLPELLDPETAQDCTDLQSLVHRLDLERVFRDDRCVWSFVDYDDGQAVLVVQDVKSSTYGCILPGVLISIAAAL